MTTTISQVYDSYAQAQNAVRELERAGVPTSDISLVANKYVSAEYDNVDSADGATTGAGVGAVVGGGAGLLAGLGLMAIPGIGPVVAAGWLASTAAGALAGGAAGGIIGALVGAGVSEEDAHVYSEAVRRGGTMVTARVPDSLEQRARDIMNRDATDIAARRRQYQSEGWTRFDPDAPQYRPSEEEIRRMRAESRTMM